MSTVETEVITIQVEIGKIDTKDTEVQEILETDGQEGTPGGHKLPLGSCQLSIRQGLCRFAQRPIDAAAEATFVAITVKPQLVDEVTEGARKINLG